MTAISAIDIIIKVVYKMINSGDKLSIRTHRVHIFVLLSLDRVQTVGFSFFPSVFPFFPSVCRRRRSSLLRLLLGFKASSIRCTKKSNGMKRCGSSCIYCLNRRSFAYEPQRRGAGFICATACSFASFGQCFDQDKKGAKF